MKFIAESFEQSELEEVGGKGLHLQKLIHWEAEVPAFFILTTDSYRYWKKHGQLPPEVFARISDFLKHHSPIALRSSMIGEDNAEASFAGMFETLLDVTTDSWQEGLKKIYHSVNAPRVREYLERKKIQAELAMAVVVQKQINVQKSGVLFTRSPITPTSALAIDAAFGMGEGVVSGHALVDHYKLTRRFDLIEYRAENTLPVLNSQEQTKLAQEGLRLESLAGYPSDIEWGILEDKIYIFQLRPITQVFLPLTVLVDTNLSESYPGQVSPLTAKFVQVAYQNVFLESAQIMGASAARLATLRPHYARLISHVDHHLYYNLEHYYAILRALPGGEKNIQNWHQMIGGNIDATSIPYHSTELSKKETLLSVLTIFNLILDRQTISRYFLASLERKRREIENQLNDTQDWKSSVHLLGDLLERPLGFGLTVVNDFFIMLGLGILSRKLKKQNIPQEKIIDLLKTDIDVDSLKPLETLNFLAKNLKPKFLEKLKEAQLEVGIDPYTRVLKSLAKEFPADVQLVQDFLKTFGDRSFEELKLESLPLSNDPQLFLKLLNWAQLSAETKKASASSELHLRLSWWDRKVVSFTRDCIAMREATRLWRGRYYHLIRRLILRLSVQLKQDLPPFRNLSVLDFFSINHHEWKIFATGEFTQVELLQRIKDRAGWQAGTRTYPEIIQWVESEKLPVLTEILKSSDLTGQGVSGGIAEGVALVLENPAQAFEAPASGYILVTKNTDPAWVYIMSRSRGLISEKGSLLSHTAIIGRELGIPTLVGVKGATTRIKTGDWIRLNAEEGKVEIL
jgi:rifampicin phosphotransferase